MLLPKRIATHWYLHSFQLMYYHTDVSCIRFEAVCYVPDYINVKVLMKQRYALHGLFTVMLIYTGYKLQSAWTFTLDGTLQNCSICCGTWTKVILKASPSQWGLRYEVAGNQCSRNHRYDLPVEELSPNGLHEKWRPALTRKRLNSRVKGHMLSCHLKS